MDGLIVYPWEDAKGFFFGSLLLCLAPAMLGKCDFTARSKNRAEESASSGHHRPPPDRLQSAAQSGVDVAIGGAHRIQYNLPLALPSQCLVVGCHTLLRDQGGQGLNSV